MSRPTPPARCTWATPGAAPSATAWPALLDCGRLRCDPGVLHQRRRQPDRKVWHVRWRPAICRSIKGRTRSPSRRTAITARTSRSAPSSLPISTGDKLSAGRAESAARPWSTMPCPKTSKGCARDLGRYRIDLRRLVPGKHPAPGRRRQDGDRACCADRGMTYEKDGAIWYKATEYGGEKDEVLVRANGNPTYFAADIAYHYNKFAVRGLRPGHQRLGRRPPRPCGPPEGRDGRHRPGRQQAGYRADAAGAPDEGRRAVPDEQAHRQGDHPVRPDWTRCRSTRPDSSLTCGSQTPPWTLTSTWRWSSPPRTRSIMYSTPTPESARILKNLAAREYPPESLHPRGAAAAVTHRRRRN